MGWLLKREWLHWKKDIFKQLLVMIGFPLLFFIIFFILHKVKGSAPLTIGSYELRIPEEVYILLGPGADTQAGTILGYLFLPIVFINVWIAWKGCMRAVYAVHEDERSGSIFGMCNQLYNRKQLGKMKLLWSLGSFFGNYVIWSLFLILLIIIGSANHEQRIYGIKVIAGILMLGSVVNGMFISAIFLYTTCRQKKSALQISTGVDLLIFGPLVLGNLYKIRDIAYLLTQKLELKFEWIQTMFKWLDGLYWLSPLSWLNPYALQWGSTFAAKWVICAVIFVIMAVACIACYERRNFYDYY